MTDDRGVYRIFGLPPGKYVVAANVTDRVSAELTQLSDADMDEILARLQRRSAGLSPTTGTTTARSAMGAAPARPDSAHTPSGHVSCYAPIYYPGTPDLDPSRHRRIFREGEERAGIDLELQLVRTAAVEGHVSAASGAPPLGTQVTLMRQSPRGSVAYALVSSGTARQVEADGSFRFTGVQPGKYRIVARAKRLTPYRGSAPSAATVMSSVPAADALGGVSWALADVTIEGADVSGLALMLQPALRLTGRLAFNANTQTPPRDLTTIRLRLVDVNGASPIVPMGSGRTDGTFEIDGVIPGTYSLAWCLRQLTRDGGFVPSWSTAATCWIFRSSSATRVTSAMALSRRSTTSTPSCSGSLQGVRLMSPLPTTSSSCFRPIGPFWRPASRRVQFTRPSTDGHFTLRDLPAGDYLIAALTDLDPSDLVDVSFMERLIPVAVPVHLKDGEKKTQDVRIVR